MQNGAFSCTRSFTETKQYNAEQIGNFFFHMVRILSNSTFQKAVNIGFILGK
jgi:hypothetical protein